MGYSSVLLENTTCDSFANIQNISESLTRFVYESVDFELCMSIDEAVMLEEDDASTEVSAKDETFKASVKKHADKIWQKIKEFFAKFMDFCKKVFQKIAISLETKGNAVMKGILSNSDAVVGKDIKVKMVKNANVIKTVFTDSVDIMDEFDKVVNKCASSKTLKEDEIFSDFYANSKIVQFKDLFKTDFGEDSDDIKYVTIDAGALLPVKKVYDMYVDVYFEMLSKNYKNVEKSSKKLAKDLTKFEKALKNVERAEEAKVINKISADSMAISNGSVKFTFNVLTLATKNAAKIAMSAVSKKTGEKLAKGE